MARSRVVKISARNSEDESLETKEDCMNDSTASKRGMKRK